MVKCCSSGKDLVGLIGSTHINKDAIALLESMTTNVLVLGRNTVETLEWAIKTFEIIRQISDQSGQILTKAF